MELAKDNTTDCHEQLDKLIWDSLTSKHCINKSSNVDLSFSIVSLFDIFIVLEERLKSRQRRTRQGASKPSETQQLLNEFIELKKKVDDQIVEAFRQLGGESDPILKGITLTPQQLSLLFDADRIPPDEAHQLCVFCHHYSINPVRENEGMGQRNNAKDTRHKEKIEVWTEYLVLVEASKKQNEDPPSKPDDPHSMSNRRRS